MESETGARTKFIRKIAVKQRQFNFETTRENTTEIPSVRELPDEPPKVDFPEIMYFLSDSLKANQWLSQKKTK